MNSLLNPTLFTAALCASGLDSYALMTNGNPTLGVCRSDSVSNTLKDLMEVAAIKDPSGENAIE